MASNQSYTPAPPLPPPRFETGALGWMRENLFNSRLDATLTVVVGALTLIALFFGLRWVFLSAEWEVIVTIGGRFFIGNYNSDQVCPGNDCFWRPQVSLLLITMLLGMAWGVAGSIFVRRIAIGVPIVIAASALLPYSLEEMGWDVRLLLVANIPAVAIGYAIARYTTLITTRRIVYLSVVSYLLILLLLTGIPGIPGMQTVDVRDWSGLTLNLVLAVSGIVLSLPIGIALALGRRSDLPVLKLICVIFIEVFRGVPLITLLFMSQHIVPLAFPEAFPRNSLLNAGIVITLFSSAYMAENVRGGLQALHPGQAEAARALGLPGWQTMLFISLPQAIRNVIPAIVGQFIGLFKDTSLVYIIGMLDIVEIGYTIIRGRVEYQGSTHEVFVFIAIVFWIFTYGMSYVSRHVERRLGVGER